MFVNNNHILKDNAPPWGSYTNKETSNDFPPVKISAPWERGEVWLLNVWIVNSINWILPAMVIWCRDKKHGPGN